MLGSYRRIKPLFFLSILLAVNICSNLTFTPAFAATITVVNTNDSGAGTLRQAILDANSGDTILFDPSLSGGLIVLLSELDISKDLIIDSSGLPTPVTISGGGSVRVFRINTGISVIMDGLKIIDGHSIIGGGIANYGTLILNNCSLLDNDASDRGGGIINADAGDLIISGSSLTNNNSERYGGGIYNSGTLTIQRSHLVENFAAESGGGIWNWGDMSLSRVIISDNLALSSGNENSNSGGGITNVGSMTLTECTLSGNESGTGGGVYNNGTMTLTNSALSGNSAIFSSGAIFNAKNATIMNSTISKNDVTHHGGGIFNRMGTLTLINSTLSGNEALISGGIYNDTEATLNYANSIIANSVSGGDCFNAGGTIATNTHNLVQDGSCGASMSGDPLLGPMADNGGPTQTQALLPGSPAIDVADEAHCPTVDQRGVPRPQGAGCDIGAFEVDTTAPSVSVEQAADQEDPTSISPIKFTVTFNEPIDRASFISSAISLNGTAGATNITITETDPHNATTFSIAVSGMVTIGSVIVTIEANKVQDIAGNGNLASTSNDNHVEFVMLEGFNIYLPCVMR